jgi:uncharacterized protein (TIGR02646 family)
MRTIRKHALTSAMGEAALKPMRDYVKREIARAAPKVIYSSSRIGGATLEQFLLKEQMGLCCYCMQRIDRAGFHIEHCNPQSRFENEQVNYYNLYLSCGKSGQAKPNHCGEFKKDNLIPRVISYWDDKNKEGCESFFKFNENGEIIPLNLAGSDSKSQRIIDNGAARSMPVLLKATVDILNLNCDDLKEKRKAASRTVKDLPNDLIKLKRTLNRYEMTDENGCYEPLYLVTIQFLKDKIRRLELKQ